MLIYWQHKLELHVAVQWITFKTWNVQHLMYADWNIGNIIPSYMSWYASTIYFA